MDYITPAARPRPRLDEHISLNVTTDMRDAVWIAAEAEGVAPSDWLRAAIHDRLRATEQLAEAASGKVF